MYTVYNQGTNSANVIDGSSLYPTRVDNTRASYKDSPTSYYLTSTGTPYPDGESASKSYNFTTANQGSSVPVANVSYNWVDGFVPNDGMKSDEHVAGRTNNSGQLFLMYGTNSVKSSAEFEGQFD